MTITFLRAITVPASLTSYAYGRNDDASEYYLVKLATSRIDALHADIIAAIADDHAPLPSLEIEQNEIVKTITRDRHNMVTFNVKDDAQQDAA